MQRRNACARQVPSSSVEMFLNVQPVPSISPAAALSFGMRRMSRPEKSPRFENTVRMGKAMVRRERLKHPAHLGVQPADEGLFFVDLCHEGGHAHDRRLVRAGKSRMPLLRPGDELSGAAALFVHGDHGALFADARHRRAMTAPPSSLIQSKRMLCPMK